MSTTDNCVHYDRGPMRSCIYGLAVGDALGVPYEFCERDTFECTGMADGGTHGRVCTVDGLIVGSHDAACEYCSVRRAGVGKADMGIKCLDCGDQIDRIDKGGVFVCEKGEPPMREVGYYRRHCDSTVIFLKKCEPKGVDHD